MNTKILITFEWDEGNMHKSVTKHGITNYEAESAFLDESHIIFPSYNKLGESRYLCIGKSSTDKIITNVFCYRNDKIRIISSRKSRENEKASYQTK